MRILVASAPHGDTFGYAMPPPGLLRLGGELERSGWSVRLEDLAHRVARGELRQDEGLAEEGARLLLARGPADVLGLSVMGATTPAALAIAAAYRRRSPDTRIVLGGPGTTGIDRELLGRFPQVDVVCRGEGERTLVALLARWRDGADPAGVAGLTWRDAAGAVRREADRPPLADLGELAPCAWHLLPDLAAYQAVAGEEEGLVPIDSGRGCVYDCSFCTIGRFWSRRSRELPVERLVDEVALVPALGGKAAYLCHDLFGANRRHARAFCQRLLERHVAVPWECRARLDHLDAELLELMGRAGCYRVLLGVESADPGVRERSSKAMAADIDVVRVVRDCAAAGITPILSFILGLPGEGEPELRATLELARAASLAAACNLSFHLVNPQPGCGLGDELGATSRPVEDIPPDMALGAGTTRVERELVEAHPDLFGCFAVLTGLPGGEASLRDLFALAGELPPVLMAHPKSWTLVARDTERDTLDLYRAWRASGEPWPAFARARGTAPVRDALAWEEALEAPPGRGARLLELETDPAGWFEAAPRSAGPVHLAVTSEGSRVRTHVLSPDAAALLRRASRRFPRDPEEQAALAYLAQRGLHPEPPRRDASPSPTSPMSP